MKLRYEPLFWLVAVALGAAAGYLHMIAPDPTIAALLALVCAMFLGVAQPQRPWLWAMIIAISIPGVDVYAKLSGQFVPVTRIEGAFIAGLVSGLVGAYGGAVMRRMVVKVFEKPETH